MTTLDQYYGSEELFHFRWFVLISDFVADQEPVLEEPARSVTVLSSLELEYEIQITFIAVERNIVLHELSYPASLVQKVCCSSTYKSYSYCLNNPLVYTDPSGEWFLVEDAIVAGAGFVFGYLGHGIIEGDWGWDAVKSGLITAGAAWLTYNTAGAAAGLLTDIGVNSTVSTVIGNGIGQGVGSFAGDAANQLVFNEPGEKFDINQSLQSGLYGLGGGLAAGVVDVSPLAKWDFPMHHTAKHLIRSTAYEVGGSLISGEPIKDNLTFGLNPGIFIPMTFDVLSISGSVITNKLTKKRFSATIEFGLGDCTECGPSTNEYGYTYTECETFEGYGFGLRSAYGNPTGYSFQVGRSFGSPQDYIHHNSLYQYLIHRWKR